MLKLSIIIPVYNVEQYVIRCIESCVNQDIPLSDYEIVIVNDGTKDDSMFLIRDFCNNNNNNIHIVEQINKGLSAARNTGLSVAKGNYVWFVDSDDFIEPNCLSHLLNISEKADLDILCFNCSLCFEDSRKKSFSIHFKHEGMVYSGRDFICDVSMPPAAWLALYKRHFLLDNSLYFVTGILHEDQEFTPKAYYLASRIMFVPLCFYNYYQREGGIMKSTNGKKAIDLLKVADSLYCFTLKNIKPGTKCYYYFINKISFAFSQSLSNYFFCNEIICLSDYKLKPYYPLNINRYLSLKEILKYTIISYSISFYIKLYKLK